MEIRKPDEIVKEFNVIIRNLISKLEKKSKSDVEIANLDRLKKRISLFRATMGDSALVATSAPFFIEYSEQVISRDEKFFNSMDVRAEYIKRKGKIEKNDEFIFGLIDSIKYQYNKSSQTEKDIIYSEVKSLFDCSVEYKLAVSP
ncbi:Hypothetical protein PACV_337 [Pacmanvirus A23]|uniref:Hypothetical protein n=1 Tax=Pacmanvirus A23 TaxID=1932881 RepID=UPI000A096273|nr:Hypothetical protein B9W72_gp333 [Pacmanvirus A23]SIP86050.1 Hypothetical protein PACV_337 [Pacmanvirus A23]